MFPSTLPRVLVMFRMLALRCSLGAVVVFFMAADAGAQIAGDANADGIINQGDVAALLDDLSGVAAAPGDADCNGDGQVDAADVLCLVITVVAAGPPPLDEVVTPLPITGAPPFLDTIEFLVNGFPQTQTEVDPGALDPLRAAVIRGRVLTSQLQPILGATISALNSDDIGQTRSRADGTFDFVVNGGGEVCIEFELSGFLPSQRMVQVTPQDFTTLDDVILIQLDPVVTMIDLSAPAPIQTARASVISDARGTRQATLLFAQGTAATMLMGDGSQVPISQMAVRATEYTAGPNGRQAMPGILPPASAYTYAVELSVDEALAAGATRVEFDTPVVLHLDNFLGFPVGVGAPIASYDRAVGAWQSSPDGRVIEIVSISTGVAALDFDGDGQAEDGPTLTGFGVTLDEQNKLGELYAAGKTLWRVRLEHFSPYDINWFLRELGVVTPPSKPAKDPRDKKYTSDEELDRDGFGTLASRNQRFTEKVSIPGTPFRLVYTNDRVRGHLASRKLDIEITDDRTIGTAERIELRIDLLGEVSKFDFPIASDQDFEFLWDGLDGYGRDVFGRAQGELKLSYFFPAVYVAPDDFETTFGTPPIPGFETGINVDEPIARSRTQTFELENRTFENMGFGGWTLSDHHFYDGLDNILFRGDGRRLLVDSLSTDLIVTVGGGGDPPDGIGDGIPALQAKIGSGDGIGLAPDGTLYFADGVNSLIRKVTPDGIMQTIGGVAGVRQFTADGAPALGSPIDTPIELTVGPTGTVYYFEPNAARIRTIDADGLLQTIAGDGTQTGFTPDGQSIRTSTIGNSFPNLVALSDGTVYFHQRHPTDSGLGQLVRRIDPVGIVQTIAGGGAIASAPGVTAPSTDVKISRVDGMAADAAGNIFIADGSFIWMADISGNISVIAGVIGFPPNGGNGGLATEAKLQSVRGISVDSEGLVYVASSSQGIRRFAVGGIINVLAGGSIAGNLRRDEDIAPARAAQITPLEVVAAADRSFYMYSTVGNKLRRVIPALPDDPTENVLIASEEGDEIFNFDSSGRHIETLQSLTGATKFSFSYNPAGLLTGVTDTFGNATAIQRDGSGAPLAIVGPFGHRTELTLNPQGYLGLVTKPDGAVSRFQYAPLGLLTTIIGPQLETFSVTYDADGDALSALGPEGVGIGLVREGLGAGFRITETSSGGLVTQFEVMPAGEGRTETVRFADGTTRGSQITAVRTITTERDGTVRDSFLSADPRLGLGAPIEADHSIVTPSGLRHVTELSRIADPMPVQNLFDFNSLVEEAVMNGRIFRKTYTPATRQMVFTSPEDRVGTVTLDASGRTLREEMAGVASADYAYDSRGRVESRTTGSGAEARTVAFQYDAAGNVMNWTDAAGRTQSFLYDAVRRPIRQTFTNGEFVELGYDASGNMTTVTPPGRPPHLFTYNALGLITAYTAPDVGLTTPTQTITYNADRLPTQLTLPDGSSIQTQYDSMNRVQRVTRPEGDSILTYDPATGNLATGLSPSGVTSTHEYDGFLETKITWSGPVAGSLKRVFNDNFQITQEQVNGVGNVINYAYDNDGVITSVGTLTYQIAPDTGVLTGTTLSNLTTVLELNSFGEVAAQTTNLSASLLYKEAYERDKLGRITRRTISEPSVSDVIIDYAYDTAGRVQTVQRDSVEAEAYTYGTNGGRTSGPTAAQGAGAYDAQDRAVSYGSILLTQNANGARNTRTDGGNITQYAWDSSASLVRVDLPGGAVVEYIYDHLGRRVARNLNAAADKRWLYRDELNPVAELDGANQLVSLFFYGKKTIVPEYMTRGGVTYRFVHDHVGSPVLVVDASTGAVAQRLKYDSFGNVLVDTNPGFQPFGFAGGLYDPDTGLVKFGEREYDAELGRFISKDPAMFFSGDANLYTYACNDTINAIDPTGRGPADITGVRVKVLKTIKSNGLQHFKVPGGIISVDGTLELQLVHGPNTGRFGESHRTYIDATVSEGGFAALVDTQNQMVSFKGEQHNRAGIYDDSGNRAKGLNVDTTGGVISAKMAQDGRSFQLSKNSSVATALPGGNLDYVAFTDSQGVLQVGTMSSAK